MPRFQTIRGAVFFFAIDDAFSEASSVSRFSKFPVTATIRMRTW